MINTVTNETTNRLYEKSKSISKCNQKAKPQWSTFYEMNASTQRMNRKFACTMCKKTFTKLSNVKDHIRTHLGTQPYACQFCNQRFS